MSRDHCLTFDLRRLGPAMEADGLTPSQEQIILREAPTRHSRRFLERVSAGVTDTGLAVQFDDTGRFILSQGQAVPDDPVRPAAPAYAAEA